MSEQEIQKAANIFQFLAEAQKLKTKTTYKFEGFTSAGKGWSHFLTDLPDHPAVRWSLGAEAEATTDLVVVSRVKEPTLAPAVPTHLSVWIEPSDDPFVLPTVSAEIEEAHGIVLLSEQADVKLAVETWLAEWRTWAEVAKPEIAARKLYERLYEMNTQLQSSAGQAELLLCSGLVEGVLGGKEIARHLVVAPLELQYRADEGGDIAVMFSGACRVEDDFVETTMLGDPVRYNDAKQSIAQVDASGMAEPETIEVVRSLALQLSASLRFNDSWQRQAVGEPGTVVSVSPMLLLRKRQGRSLIAFLEAAMERLSEENALPAGLRPLVDVVNQPPDDSGWGEGDGALFEAGDNEYLAPLPLNDTQMRVIRDVTSKAQTVVQGPPGTGKTHTSAALIAHLLSLGKRVLITAHTDQALEEIRNKLPDSVKDLAVASIGNSQQQLSELAASVQVINDQIESFDFDVATREEQGLLTELDGLRRSRTAIRNARLEARRQQVLEISVGGVSRTIGAHAKWLAESHDELGWLHDDIVDEDAPLDDAQVRGMVLVLRDEQILALLDEARSVPAYALPSNEEFEALLAQASAIDACEEALGRGQLIQPAQGEGSLLDLAAELDTVVNVEPFAQFLGDVYHGAVDRDPALRPRLHETALLVADHDAFIQDGGGVPISCTAEPTALLAKADAVEAHLRSGKSFKLNADGTPKTGLLSGTLAKNTQDLFGSVLVNHRPPSDLQSIQLFKAWVDLSSRLANVEARWNLSSGGAHLVERIELLRSLIQRADAAIALRDRASGVANSLSADVTVVASAENARVEVLRRQTARIAELRAASDSTLDELTSAADKGTFAWQAALVQAVNTRDAQAYASVLERFGFLRLKYSEYQLAMDRLEQLRAAAPKYARELEARIDLGEGSFELAWQYARTKSVVQSSPGGEQLASIANLDRDIHRLLGDLAHVRAWKHALAADRIGPTTRADLVSYSQLTKKVGKGTGKHAAKFSMEARRVLERVRPAVPAWIMPLYRVWEQLEAQPGLFDVIVVDEASQAGVEAVALQLLAPRMVVIGDDKQVSPDAVGLKQDELSALARQFLPDDRYRATWEIPQRSLFDDAKMRYGGVITLREHRRCVPPIIEFSNRIAYEPENIRLEPTRQLGQGVLQPMRASHVPTGYRNNEVNLAEAESLVQTVIDCTNDPVYDGMSFGVITLQGSKQARKIESLLLSKLDPEELGKRQLRVGSPASFQGSERNVIFASLVVDAEGRSAALTKDSDIQRFNVAVSRAKDQFWLFHSTSAGDIANTSCLRRQLIEYCYEVEHKQSAGYARDWTTTVSSVEREHPFDSLFEQRVFNELVGRGYVVQPQAETMGRRIDLVVHGYGRKLAIECDGDHWHGPEQWANDDRRQRSLEACGWEFHRIRESDFYLDTQLSVDELLSWLTEGGVLPGAVPANPASDTKADGYDDVDEVLNQLLAGRAPAGTAEENLQRAASVPEIEEPAPQLQELPNAPQQADPPPSPLVTSRAEDEPKSGTIAAPQSAEVFSPGFASYRSWVGRPLTKISDMPRTQLGEAIVEVVEAEGPITVGRLYKLLNQAAGGSRASQGTRSAINKALNGVDGRSVVVFKSQNGGYVDAWVRSVDQPDVHIREIGPRDVDEIPALELAAVMRRMMVHGHVDEEELFRDVMAEYGLSRLTSKRRDMFEEAIEAARTMSIDGG